jgi:cytochrome P450
MATTSATGGSGDLPVVPAPRAARCPLEPPAEFAMWRETQGLQRASWHGEPTWVISRYQDIRAALIDPRLSADTLPDFVKPTGTDDGAR